MKIDWSTVVAVALGVLIAAVVKQLILDKALAKVGMLDADGNLDEFEQE